ncbi:MAG: hypothetical protein KUG72_09905 [Pseudomonadales bacterium]|nr:hypothetical protein [Pseudomonadales bacterium]
MNLTSRHQQYLKQLGIESWVPRVDRSFFPGAPEIPVCSNDSIDPVPGSTDEDDLAIKPGKDNQQFYCCFEFGNRCAVVVETDVHEEPIPADQQRLLSGILRAIGIGGLSEATAAYSKGCDEVETLLSRQTNSTVTLFFGTSSAFDRFDPRAPPEKVLLADSLQQIMRSAVSKQKLWLMLKTTGFIDLPSR